MAQNEVDRNPRAALVIIVPEAEPLVGDFRAKHDPIAALGLPAHITINFPFIPGVDPTADTLDRLRKTFAEAQPFAFTLDHIGRFPNVVYLAPTPSAPFVQLAERIADEFPESPPYGGQFDDITPHLTFAYSSDSDTLDSVEQAFSETASAHLPLNAAANQVWLMDDTSGRWHKRVSFSLGARY
ncbi:MAG: 2'-5' RNA ligase family protein [Chloroflexi bacterium]|nr:2'-5' RNA ligase family protein [Chloroflexota bacterium]